MPSHFKIFLFSAACLFFWNQSFAAFEKIPFKEKRKYRFVYEVTIKITKDHIGKEVSLWVPFPVNDHSQKVLTYDVTSPWDYRLTTDSKYGNRMIYLHGIPSENIIRVIFNYDIERSPDHGYQPSFDNDSPALSHYLGPNKLVPFYPLFKELADKEATRLKKPSQKIRAYYNYVVNTMKYDKSGTGWGQGNAVWACTTQRGNCTDFHSLFIGMSRSQNIPARFEIGFPIPYDKKSGTISGYHCWAQAYAEDQKKWIPIDATEAKKTGKITEYFGLLPSNRIHFSRGRDIVLNPPQKSAPLNYFIYPYAEVSGKPLRNIQKKFSFKRY